MSLPPSRPVRLGEPLDLARPTTNPAAITRPPVLGNIDQIAIPQQGGASTISPTVYTRDLNVPGTNIGVETPRRMPGDVGDQFYRPVAGDPLGEPFSRNGRPLRNAGIGEPLNSNGATPTPRRGPAPVNSPSPGATVSAPQVANPGRAVNPRTPLDFGAPPRGLAAGSLAAGGALSGYGEFERSRAEGGGRLENLGAGVIGFGGAAVGAYYGLQAGAGVGVATANPVVGGAVAIGASVAGQQIGGRIGSRAGRDIGRVADNFVGRFFPDWNTDREQYENQLDPAAMGQGPVTTEGQIESGGTGQTPGVAYAATYTVRMVYSWGGGQDYSYSGVALFFNDVQSANPVGPVGSPVRVVANGRVSYQVQADRLFYLNLGGSISRSLNTFDWALISFSLSRLDGQEDPPSQPAVDPVYAPNPARTAPQGNPDRPWESPANLPAPPLPYRPLPTEDAPQIWPFADPLDLGEPRLQPEPELPPTFEPSPNLANIPSAEPAPNPIPAGRPDLSPDAAPGSNPGADLATDPDTPTQPDPLGAKLQDAPEGGGLPRTFELADGTRVTDNEDGSRTIVWPYGTTQEEAIRRSNPSPVIVPVMIPVGGRQAVTTPAWNLTNDPSQRDNPFTQQQTPRVVQSSSSPPKGVCRYEQQRVADIQAKATATQQQASNPTSGFTGLYGIGIESRVKIGESFTLLQQVNQFMRKAWEMTRMQKILDVLTFIGVMHNVGMLSRDVGETFFQLITQGLQAVGIRDEEGGIIQVEEVVGNTVENVLKGILGEAVYNGVGEAWNKANRIISSASAIIWTVRSIADSSLDLMEWIGENTGRIGNALKRWGVVGERSYPWMSESAQAQSRFRNRFSKVTDALENTEDRISVFTQATSNVIEIQEETAELGENWQRFRDSVENGIPDPWGDNAPVANQYAADQAVSDGPDVPPADAQKGG